MNGGTVVIEMLLDSYHRSVTDGERPRQSDLAPAALRSPRNVSGALQWLDDVDELAFVLPSANVEC